jgi:hypothetical protein
MIINSNATAKELEELAEVDNTQICQQIARHPNSSPELLKKLFHQYFREVLENPVLELILLENPTFISDLDDSTHCNHFQREQLPLFCYKIALNYPDVWFRKAIALNPNTPINILKELSVDKNIEVLSSLANNKNISNKIIKQLAKEQEYYVILGLAGNPKTPQKLLGLLAKNGSPEIRSAIVRNSNTPSHILEFLAKNADREIGLHLAMNPKIPTRILEQLSQHEDDLVRQRVLHRQHI